MPVLELSNVSDHPGYVQPSYRRQQEQERSPVEGPSVPALAMVSDGSLHVSDQEHQSDTSSTVNKGKGPETPWPEDLKDTPWAKDLKDEDPEDEDPEDEEPGGRGRRVDYHEAGARPRTVRCFRPPRVRTAELPATARAREEPRRRPIRPRAAAAPQQSPFILPLRKSKPGRR